MELPPPFPLEPEEKVIEPWDNMELRILGFINTPTESMIPSRAMRLTHVCDFEMQVTPKTTIREIKDFSLRRLTTLRYYQLSLEFWDKNLKDATTLESIVKKWPFFMMVKCLHLHIIVPDEMFKAMYKTFRDLGINEEKALKQTKSFMNTYQNKDIDHEYDIAKRLERCRIRLEKHGIKLNNPPPPPPCD